MPSVMVSIAKHIRIARERHGVSYETLSRMVGCSAETVRNIESGRTVKPIQTIRDGLLAAIQRLDADSASAQADSDAASTIRETTITPAVNGASSSDAATSGSTRSPARAPASAPADS